MKKNLKKIVLLLAVVATAMLCFAFSTSALDATGQCGDNVYWNYNENTGALVINGSGEMWNTEDYDASPFYNSDISSVVIESGVTTIGDYAFYECGNLGSVTIPGSVTIIGESAFCACDRLITVRIPYGVKNIGVGAFSSCDTLTNVTIPDSVTTIGENAFIKCYGLTNVTIPDSVTEIGNASFFLCESLLSVSISENVTIIGDYAFAYCENLVGIYVDENNRYYSDDGCGVLFDKNKTKLIQYPNGNSRMYYEIPDTVKVIGYHSFAGSDTLEGVIIPDSVFEIKGSAFNECDSLKSVTIPAGTTIIHSAVFSECDSLTYIYVDVDNQNFSNDSLGVLFDKNKTRLVQYPMGSERTSYNIPEGVKSIDYQAFCQCDNLKSITIPASVTKIEDEAFLYCSNITDIYYNGTQEQWEKITDECEDKVLIKATIHYNNKPMPSLGKTEKIIATQNTSEIRLNWTAVEDAEGYRVYQKINRKWVSMGIVMKNVAVIKNLTAGTKYSFAVKAGKVENGETVWSDEYTIISTATKTVAPSKITSAQSTSAIKLAWTASSGADGYRIFYKSGGKWKTTVSSTTALSHTFNNLKAGAKYTFAIQPYIKTASGVVWGEYIEFTTSTKPATPTVKTTAPSKGKVTVNWNAVNGAEAYQLYYKKGNGSYALYKTYNKAGTLTFSNLKSGTKYTFAVRAVIKTDGGNVRSGYKEAAVTVK